MNGIIGYILHNPWFVLVGTVTLIQISPIKINPWTWLGKAVRNFLGIGELRKDLEKLEKDFLEEKVNNKRWNCLDFANSCLQGRKHTKEEWEHVIDELRIYDKYCEDHKIPNGVMVECGKFLRDTYRERLQKNDFLK